MAGFAPAIHAARNGLRKRKAWMAGTSPAMTARGGAEVRGPGYDGLRNHSSSSVAVTRSR
jgi:hypothetical protein